MNLAEATAQLRQKESEKMTCLDEIQKLEALRFDGYVGIVSVTVLEVKGADNIANFVISAGGVKSDPVHIGGEVTLRVMRDDTELKVEGLVAPSESENSSEVEAEQPKAIKFRAVTDIRTLPTDTYLQTELDAASSADPEINASFRVKLSFSSINVQLESKNTELEQIFKQMEDVKEAIRSRASSGSGSTAGAAAKPAAKGGKKAATKKGASKKSAGSAASKAVRDEAEDTQGDEVEGGSLTDTVISAVISAKDVAFKNYSIGLFALATAAVYYYGDYASV